MGCTRCSLMQALWKIEPIKTITHGKKETIEWRKDRLFFCQGVYILISKNTYKNSFKKWGVFFICLKDRYLSHELPLIWVSWSLHGGLNPPKQTKHVCHVTPRRVCSAKQKDTKGTGGLLRSKVSPRDWLIFRSHSIDPPNTPPVRQASETRVSPLYIPSSYNPTLSYSMASVRRATLFMLIGVGCFGLWHRHLALTVNYSFLSHLAKELKPAILGVRIRHLKMKVHTGKPREEGQVAGCH